jgi:hypothetical protein
VLLLEDVFKALEKHVRHFSNTVTNLPASASSDIPAVLDVNLNGFRFMAFCALNNDSM